MSDDPGAHMWSDPGYQEWLASLRPGDGIIWQTPGGDWNVMQFVPPHAFRQVGFGFKTLEEAKAQAQAASLIIRSVDPWTHVAEADGPSKFAPDHSRDELEGRWE